MADATTNALLAESKCLVCYPDSVQLEMQTYIIAHAAGVGMDPIQLAKDAKCFTCLNPLTLVEAKLYLLARIAQIGTDPVDLLEGTECYECIPQGMLTSVETNDLVNDPASPSTDPATIARLSRCFGCLSGQTLLEVQVYLLALIANVTPTTEEIERVIPPIDRIPPGRIRSVIVRQQGRIRNGGGLIPTHCTDVAADLIPVITGTWASGALTSISITLPKVCCRPHHLNIYQADDATGTNATVFSSKLMSGVPGGSSSYTTSATIGIALTQAYVLVTQVCTGGTESGFSNGVLSFDGSTAASAWAARVVANGGAAPSANSVSAAATFWQSLNLCGIFSKMKAVNMLAPDSLIAAQTPLIVGTGSDPWTNVNFVGGDLTVHGLKGNTTTKSLLTGIVPNVVFASDTSGGISVYYMETTSGGATVQIAAGTSDVGVSSNRFFLGQAQTAGEDRFACYDSVTGQGLLQPVASSKPGLLSANRTAANLSTDYYASGITPAFSQGTIATTGGTRPNQQMRAFALNSTAGAAANWTPQRISFIAIHEGLTIAEVDCLNSAVDTLRRNFGGGYFPLVTIDTMESYTSGEDADGLNGGLNGLNTSFAGAYESHTPWMTMYSYDDMETYSDGAAVAGLNGGATWNSAYAT